MKTTASKYLVGAFTAFIVSAACARDVHVDDIARLRHELSVARTRAMAAEAMAKDAAVDAKQAREERDEALEKAKRASLALASLTGSEARTSAPPPSTGAAANSEAHHRGGFTDWAQSNVGGTPPAVPASVAVVQPTRTAAIAVDPLARDYCTREWPTDFSMQAWCEEKEMKGKAALDSRQWRDVGLWSQDFDGIRAHCAAEWPGSYSMRDWCEGKQIEGWKKTHGMPGAPR